MKNLTKTIIAIAVIIVFVYACKKETATHGNASLTGKWKFTSSLADPGDGSGKWMAVPDKANYDYLQFDSDGKLESNLFGNYGSYTIKDSVTLVFKATDNTLQNYRYNITGNILTMSPAGPIMCIEACGQRFTKL